MNWRDSLAKWVRFGLGLSQPASLTDEQIGVTMLINNIRSRPLERVIRKLWKREKLSFKTLCAHLTRRVLKFCKHFKKRRRKCLVRIVPSANYPLMLWEEIQRAQNRSLTQPILILSSVQVRRLYRLQHGSRGMLRGNNAYKS